MKSETVNQGRVFTSSQDDGARNAPALPVGGRVSRVEVTQSDDGPFLPHIEEPNGLLLKFVYAMSRWQFGKVLTPLKVVSARMPLAFGLFAGKIGSLDKKLLLPRETVMLIREQVARINVCLFCIDIGRSFTIKSSMNQAKFDALEDYRTSPFYRCRFDRGQESPVPPHK